MEEKRYKITHFMRSALAVAVILFLLYMERIGRQYPNNIQHMEPVRFIGTYQENETSKPIKLTEDTIPDGTLMPHVVLKGHFDREIPKGTQLFLFMYRTRATIIQNGTVIFTYGEPESVPSISKSIGIEWANLKSDGIRESDEIEIRISLVYDDNYKAVYRDFLSNLCTGERYALMAEQIRKNMLQIMISILIFLEGLILVTAMCSLHFMKIPRPAGGISCGMILISGALCTFIDYNYITLLFVNGYFVNMLDNILMLVICECVAMYLQSYIANERYRWISECILSGWTVMSLVYVVLQVCGVADAPDLIQFYIPLAVVMLLVISGFLVKDAREHLDHKIRSVLGAGLVLIASAAAELVHYYFANCFWIVVLQSGLIFFSLSQMSMLLHSAKQNFLQAQRAEELEKELIQSRIAIMMSQIQPHFLYNTLTSIQELCLTAPEKAHTAITWFAQFLRSNMDSLSTTELIPFEKELHHVQNYLRLEAVRFGSRLNTKYDIQVSDFKIPALCVQPIVENAVRYGISKKEEGGTVTIQTFEDKKEIFIIVKDDGVGFKQGEGVQVEYQDKTKRTHVGIENVKKRMKEQCGGLVQIKSCLGVGTEVLIKIPRERAK